MGGGGGFSPISIISDIVFGGIASSLLGGTPTTGASTTVADTSAQEAALAEAEARRKADRKKTETSLLAKARQADRASQDTVAASLGAPSVATSGLKERLGQ